MIETLMQEWTCRCGTVNRTGFCSVCGKGAGRVDVNKIWSCVCGAVNLRDTCYACGRPKCDVTGVIDGVPAMPPAADEVKRLGDMIERLDTFLIELRVTLIKIREDVSLLDPKNGPLPATKDTVGTPENCMLEILRDWKPGDNSEARYPGIEPSNDLVIMPGGNGDWYVAVVSNGQGCMGKAIRLETSGGASTKCPGLTIAIADAYRAMKKAGY